MIQCSIVAVLGLTFNAIALFRISKQNSNSSIRKQKIENALFLVSIFDFIVELIYVIHQGVMYKLILEGRLIDPLFDTLYLQLPWIHDLKSFTRPFLLVIICRNVRISFFGLLKSISPTSSIGNSRSTVVENNVPIASIGLSVAYKASSQQITKIII